MSRLKTLRWVAILATALFMVSLAQAVLLQDVQTGIYCAVVAVFLLVADLAARD